jgi:hypothetical protein
MAVTRPRKRPSENRLGEWLDTVRWSWELPTMNATLTDDRRRLVMPPELPPKSPVTVQQIDQDTWLVKRARPEKTGLVMLLPDVKRLPADADWQTMENRIVAHNAKNVAPFEA